jgi:hypothetical protein
MGYKKTVYSRLDKILSSIESDYVSTWCRVDIDNVFTFDNTKMIIDSSVGQYKVYNIPELNTAKMDKILVINTNGNYKFYDQNADIIKNKYIKAY